MRNQILECNIRIAFSKSNKFLTFLVAVFIGLLCSIVIQNSFIQTSHGLYFGTGYNATVAGNAGGGAQNAVQPCATDMVVVGVGMTVNGSNPGFGVYCRAMGADGQLVAQDQSSASNTTAVGGGNNKVFCPAGQVVTGISFIIWTNVGIRCATPPLLTDNSAIIWYTSTTATPASTNCTSGIVAGFFTRTGAWTDAIGAYCLPFSLNTITYNVNGGSGSAPASQTQTAPAQSFTVSTYTGTRAGFRLSGWNTQANGLGTDYASGSSLRPIGAVSLYAKWLSTITYNGNSNTAGAVPESTTAVSSAAVTVLAFNDGSSVSPNVPLSKTGFTFVGWNTQADGTGTSYVASNPALVTETPYMWFDAADFDDSTNAWTDSSGNSRSIPGTAVTSATAGSIRGNPTRTTNAAGANGATKSFPAVKGTINDGIVIGNGALTNYTMCHVARYAGTNKGQIFNGTIAGTSWFSGFWNTVTGVANHQGWITASSGTSDTNWKIQCDTGGSSSSLRSNGVLKSTVANNSTGLPADIAINLYGSRTAPSQTSDWEVAEFIIYNSVLSDSKIKEIEERLNRKYGVSLFTPSVHTYTYASTGNITLYAQWNSTITYDGNGQTSLSSTVPAATTAKGTAANTTLANAGTMVKTGYTFAGWNTQVDGLGTNYSSGLTTYQSGGSITLYAKWTRTITYNSNGANSGSPERTTDVFTNSTTPTISTFPLVGSMVKTGYTFAGWSTTTTGAALTAPYATTGEVTLYARWTANSYSVIYDTSTVTGGSMLDTTFTAGTAFNLRANAFLRTGYTFKNWNSVANGSGTTYTNSQSVTLYGGLTLYSQWTAVAPGVPTVSVSAGNTEITVTPTAAAASGTSVGPTTSMLVTAYTSGGLLLSPSKTCNVVAPATYCMITGLTNGTTYQFAATATNTTGTSASSTKVNGIPTAYTVTYNSTVNGGTTGTTTSVNTTYNKGTPVTLANATKSGYTFSGWYTTASDTSTTGVLVGDAGGSYSPSGSITLYARFSGLIYTISYDGNGNTGGTIPATGNFQTGGSAYVIRGETNPPTRVGYTFASWYTNSTGSGGSAYSVGASYSTAENISLFAKWTPKTHTVTYALDGGTSTASTTQLTGKVIGDRVTLPAASTMSKTGYTFAGWNDSSSTYSGGDTWTVTASDSDFTLTALWTVTTLSYSYDTNGGGDAPLSGTKTYGQTLVLDSATTLSKTGYTFAGWNNGSSTSNAGASVAITSNTIFVAQWSTVSYAITYVAGGGSGSAPSNGTYTANGVPYVIASNTFTRLGYNFSGWKNSDGTPFTVGAGYSTAANLTLIAQWSPATFTITYNGNGADLGTSPATASESWTYNPVTPLSLSTAGTLTKTGYSFEGWSTTANAISGITSASPTSNTTYFAVWTANQYAVNYLPGDGSGSITSPGNKVMGSTFTLDSGASLTPPAPVGDVSYSFAYWSDGSKTYKGAATYVMPAAPVTLTAQWVAIYRVTYNGNGGTSSIASVQKAESDVVTIGVAATQTGYDFVKWSDQSGGLWSPGETTTVTAGRYLFSATWSAQTSTITFNGNNNSSGSAPASGTYVTDGTAYVIPGNTGSLTRIGYTFSGWNTASNGTGVDYPAGVGATYSSIGNLPLFAKWQANTYTITYNGNGATSGSAPANGSYLTGAASPYTVSTNSGTLAKTGFSFDGWYTTSTGTGGTGYVAGTDTLTTTSDITLFAKWIASTHAVTYNTDGGSTAPTQADTAYGSAFALPTAPTKSGNNFLGWELIESGIANTYSPGSNFTMGSSSLTFTAKWSGIYYAVVYALNGGDGSTPTQANVESGGSFVTAASPTKSGYTFSGWSNGVTTTSASTSITNVSGNITLTAQWAIAAPGVPGTPSASPGNGSATITISPSVSGGTPTSYTVTASPGGATCTVTSPGTSCTISPLTNGTAYTFTSTATNSAGSSASSSSASAAVTPAGLPSSPTGVTGSGTGGTASVSWSAPNSNGGSAITDYVVEFSVTGSDTWTTFSDGISTSTSATITGLTSGTSYQFRISAKNLIGTSPASLSSPTVSTLPTAPTITGVSTGSEQVTVTWSAPSHLGSGTLTGDEYVVTAYDSSGNEAGTCKPISGQTNCIVTGLDNGSSYTFKVAAITTIGTSAQSSASASAVPAGVPSAPSNVSAVTSGSNMTVTFNAPADNGGAAITSYIVTSDPAGATCVVGANATTYICSGLTADTNYSYTVKAVNSKGPSSASTASTPVTAIAAPSAPQNVSAVITAGTTTLSATVSFDPPATNNGSAVTSYTVTASPGGATCTVNAPITYCEISVLPDNVYTFTATATNAVGTSVASTTSLETKATNGIEPTLVVDPIPAPTGNLVENQVLSTGITSTSYNSTPSSVITYQWQRCTDPLDDTTCAPISGATNSTYALSASDVDKYIRVKITAANSIGRTSSFSDATEVITAAQSSSSSSPTSTPSTPVSDPAPVTSTCDSACQAIKDAAAAKAAADAAAKIAADKAAADAAAKLKADAAATAASTKAAADAASAAAAAKAAVEKAAAAEAAKIAADAAASAAATKAKAAADAQAAAAKAAADAQAALKSATATAAAKAAATASANKAAAEAAAAVSAAANAAKQAALAKNTATTASKQVDIAINTLTSKTAASQASAQANAIAAAAKNAANEAAAAALTKANEAKVAAAAAQKVAAETAARIVTEQKEAALAAVLAKVAADTAAKITAEKIAATTAAKAAAEDVAKVLNEKAALAEQAAKATDETIREEINKKIEELSSKVSEAEKISVELSAKAESAIFAQVEAVKSAESANAEAEKQASEAVNIKAESITKNAAASKAVATASVAAKVAAAAAAAAAKVPSKAVITTKPSTSTSKNSATATVSGLKPGQKVKVTVNVKDR